MSDLTVRTLKKLLSPHKVFLEVRSKRRNVRVLFIIMKKRIGIMIYPEILDSLESLNNEEIGKIFRLIIKYNRGEVVEPADSLEKFVWSTLFPKLEENRLGYEEKCKKALESINKRWEKTKITDVYVRIHPNTNSNYNSINNSSKEELLNDQQQTSSEDDVVVSKGLETIENIFPNGRNKIGIDEINLWESLSQQEKQAMIKRATLYIRDEKKKEDGKYIKGIGKWMLEQKKKGLEIKTKKTNSTREDDNRIFKYTDGNVYSAILSIVNTTNTADKIYNRLNRKDIFNDKNEVLEFISQLTKEKINELLNQKL